MRIDWTQTLLGPEGQLAADASGGSRLPARSILLAGRMAGLLGAVLILVGAIALSPLMGSVGARMEEMLAVSGLLVVQVIAFAIARHIGPKGVLTLATICGLQVLLAAGLGAGPAMILAVFALVVSEQVAVMMLLKERRVAATWFCLLAVMAGCGAMLMSIGEPVACALTAGIAIPALAMLPLTFARTQQPGSQAAKPSPIAALLDVALSRFPGPVLLVDHVGAIKQPDPGAMFAEHLRAASWPSASLTEMLLVVDRPLLLQALSSAIHEHLPCETLVLRMRDGAEEGNYSPKLCSIWPIPGLPGRALVMISEQSQENVEPRGPVTTPASDPALIQRAMHDAVSPFNAGLGYLELIADPRLAPRDLASTRHFAQEARSALIEAHRNTALMGRWLKLLAMPQTSQRERVDLARIAQDSARIFTTAEGDRAEIAIEADSPAVHAEISSEVARFAIGVLLRGALRRCDAVRIEIASSGTDAVIRVCPVGKAFAPEQGEDVFQMALEQAVQGQSVLRFERATGAHSLVLRGAVVVLHKAITSDEIQPLKRGRLVS